MESRSSHVVSRVHLDKIDLRPHRHKRKYISDCISTAKSLYSRDVKGHYGCINALAFSQLNQEYLITGGAPITLKQKWAMSKPMVTDSSTEVTSTTQDTWKGVEPIARPDVTSEEESELKLPDPVDYEKPLGDTTEEEPSSLINFED